MLLSHQVVLIFVCYFSIHNCVESVEKKKILFHENFHEYHKMNKNKDLMHLQNR